MSNAKNIRESIKGHFKEEFGIELYDESEEIKDSDSGLQFIELHGDVPEDVDYSDCIKFYKKLCEEELKIIAGVEKIGEDSLILKPKWS